MNIPAQTLKKMGVAAGRPARRKPLQFSILAVLALMTTSSLALCVSRPYWPAIKEALSPRPPKPVVQPLQRVQPQEWVRPVPPRGQRVACGPCGMG
jgi:hypothetical protein